MSQGFSRLMHRAYFHLLMYAASAANRGVQAMTAEAMRSHAIASGDQPAGRRRAALRAWSRSHVHLLFGILAVFTAGLCIHAGRYDVGGPLLVAAMILIGLELDKRGSLL